MPGWKIQALAEKSKPRLENLSLGWKIVIDDAAHAVFSAHCIPELGRGPAESANDHASSDMLTHAFK
jgi:hypothetical protein